MSAGRREFLQQAGKFLLLTGSAARAFEFVMSGRAEAAPDYAAAAHWWGMVVDIDKCIGCGNCVRACKEENGVSPEPYYFRTWVERYHVRGDRMEHPEVDSPNGGADGFPARPGGGLGAQPRSGVSPQDPSDGIHSRREPPDDDGGKDFFVPKLCNHCADSPCVQVCPVGATFVSPDGVVLVDKSYCLGCRYCVQACPYGCRYIDPVEHVVDKCNLCYHRITRGLTTACCEVCPTGARQLVDLKDPKDPVHEWLRTHKVQVLKPQMATHSKVFYNALDGSVR